MKALVAAIFAVVLFGVCFQVKKAYYEAPAYVGDVYVAMQVDEEMKRGGVSDQAVLAVALDFNALCSVERKNFKRQISYSSSSSF